MLPALLLLVVPYFEVSVEPQNRNFDTRIVLTNRSAGPLKVRVNVWTDRGEPVLWYTTPVEPNGSKSISMRDLLLSGTADICASPGAAVPIQLREAVRCELTTGCKLDLQQPDFACTRRIGERHAHAIGYVTLDVVDDCMDLTRPDDPSYRTLPGTALAASFEQTANGIVFESAPLGAERAFRKPMTPRDPLAKQPPRTCPPLSPPEPQVEF